MCIIEQQVTAYLAQKHRKTQSNLSNPEGQEKLHSINLVFQPLLIIPFISSYDFMFLFSWASVIPMLLTTPYILFMTSRFRPSSCVFCFILTLTLLDPRGRGKMEAPMPLNSSPVSLLVKYIFTMTPCPDKYTFKDQRHT